jgi:hypothetical protein
MGEKRKASKYSHLLIQECREQLIKEGTFWHEQQAIDMAHDLWDEHYGQGSKDYEVYALLNGLKGGNFTYGPLKFKYEPFYIGEGKSGHRCKESRSLGRQLDKFYDKVYMIKKLTESGNSIRWQVINKFQTKKKAHIVEKKIIKLIGTPPLTNHLFSRCELPLKREDYFDEEMDGIMLC